MSDRGNRTTLRKPPTLLEIRYLLNELHYHGDGGGSMEADLCKEVETALRWLLDQYLRPGTHVTNDPAVKA